MSASMPGKKQKGDFIMKEKKITYTEVRIDGTDYGRYYRNPMTRIYQHEYALFLAVSELFASVRRKSLCLESLKLYFSEMPHFQEKSAGEEKEAENTNKGKTQEKLLEEMRCMVKEFVVGQVTFPMINVCTAEATTVLRADNTHLFVFSDGIYGFAVGIEKNKTDRKVHIIVRDLSGPQMERHDIKGTDGRGKAA